jgi:hypothetical protein
MLKPTAPKRFWPNWSDESRTDNGRKFAEALDADPRNLMMKE